MHVYIRINFCGEALVYAKNRGVNVNIVVDKRVIESGNSTEVVKKLRDNGLLKGYIDINSFIMHLKFIIIDNKILINGSYNWQINADSGNFENLILSNDIHLVKRFSEEFDKIYSQYFIAMPSNPSNLINLSTFLRSNILRRRNLIVTNILFLTLILLRILYR